MANIMAKATGKRLAAVVCFLIGGLTVIGIPFLWPLGYILYRDAKEQEEERERELEALDQEASTDTAMDRLRERYADGEISNEEFEQRKATLQGDDVETEAEKQATANDEQKPERDSYIGEDGTLDI